MIKKSFFSVFLPIFCFLALINNSYAQNLPLVLGSVLEVGSELLENERYGIGITRITPFAGIWINGLGFVRIGVYASSQKETDDSGKLNEVNRFDLSAQIGYSVIGPERPYIMASYVRNKAYSQNNDARWNEWGLGIGHKFLFSPFAGIVIEAEHRWIAKHYDRLRHIDISGRKLQMNIGLATYLF